MATKEEILKNNFEILIANNPDDGIHEWESQDKKDIQMVYDSMEEYARQECAAKDAEIERLKGLIDAAYFIGAATATNIMHSNISGYVPAKESKSLIDFKKENNL